MTPEELNDLWDTCDDCGEEATSARDPSDFFYDEVERRGGHVFYTVRDRDGLVNVEFLDVLKEHGCTVLKHPFQVEDEPSWFVFWPGEPGKGDTTSRGGAPKLAPRLSDLCNQVCELINEGLPLGEAISELRQF